MKEEIRGADTAQNDKARPRPRLDRVLRLAQRPGVGLVGVLALQELLFVLAVALTGALPLGIRELGTVGSIFAFAVGSLGAVLLVALIGLGWLSLVNLVPVRFLRRALALLLYVAVFLSPFNFGFYLFSGHLANAQLLRDAPNYFAHAPALHWVALLVVLLLALSLIVLSWRCRLFGEAWRDLASLDGGPARGLAGVAGGAAVALAVASVLVAYKPDAAPALSTAAHLTTGFLPDLRMALASGDNARTDQITRMTAVDTSGLLPVSQVEAYVQGLGQQASAERPNIVVVMLEGVSVEHVGAYGYQRPTTPNLDRLATQSLLFERCWAAATESKHGQTAIHSSSWPMRGRNDDFAVIDYRRMPWWIVFRALGYRTAYISTQNEDWLHMKSFLLEGQAQPDVFVHAPDIQEGPSYQGLLGKKDEATVNRRLFRYLDEARADARPFILMTNYQRTHHPYELPNDWPAPFTPTGRFGDPVAWKPEQIPTAINSFDSALAYVDHHLGELIRYLDQLGLADKTIVAVLSDHGSGFVPGLQPVAESLADPFIHVPWILRFPAHLAPGRFAGNVSSIDLFPTLLGLLGVPQNPAWEGRDVLAMGEADSSRRTIYSGSIIWLQRWQAVQHDRKVIIDLDSGTRFAYGRDDRLLENARPIAASEGVLLRDLSTTLQSHVRFYEDPALHAHFMYPGRAPTLLSPEEGGFCSPGPEDLQAALRSVITRGVWSFEKEGMGRLRMLRLNPGGLVESLSLPNHPAESFWDLQGTSLRLLDDHHRPTTQFRTLTTDQGRLLYQGLFNDNPDDIRRMRQMRLVADAPGSDRSEQGASEQLRESGR